MYSAAVVKVCADSQQNNKKTTVLHFKNGDFAKFHQISSKINIFPQGWFLFISSAFRQKQNPLEPMYKINCTITDSLFCTFFTYCFHY